MVREKISRKPCYSLEDCQTAIKNDAYELGSKPRRDIVDLRIRYDFDLNDFKEFIFKLTTKDFSKSVKHSNSEYWYDVYVADYHIPQNNQDEFLPTEKIRIYFKFYIYSEKLFIQVVSFHESFP